jgi:bifunctional ADP-heptose synthase (sugar kinase/adenylyltransferase)
MSILLIGESCTDLFTYCESKRMCPDMPVPVLNIKHSVKSPGMASNVYRNISKHVPDCELLTNANSGEIVKNRFVHDSTNHMFCRVDTPDTINGIVLDDNIITKIKTAQIVVVSDYNKGFLTEGDIQQICNLNPTVFIDTKKIVKEWASDAFIIKINSNEYFNSRDYIDKSPLLKDKIIQTAGDQGCFYKNKQYSIEQPVEVKDSSGAGDSFLAALVIHFYKTKDIENSIIFANKCASEVVRHKGVTIIQ